MPSGKCTRKAKPGLDYFYLQTQNDVIPLMSALLTIQHDSMLIAHNVSGAAEWYLQITDTRPGSELNPATKVRQMNLGQVAVWDAGVGILSILDNTVFQTNYTVP